MVINKKRRFQVLERDGFRCRYCGANGTAEQLHVDHILPVSRGGSDDLDNLVASCHACNLGKGAHLLKDGVPIPTPRTTTSNLVGLFFHRLENDAFSPRPLIMNQGVIRMHLEGSQYLVELMSWWDGRLNGMQVMTIENGELFRFYRTDLEMRRSHDLYYDIPPEDSEFAERLNGAAS